MRVVTSVRATKTNATLAAAALFIAVVGTATGIAVGERSRDYNHIYAFGIVTDGSYSQTEIAHDRHIVGSLPAENPQVSTDDRYIVASTNNYGTNKPNFVYSYDASTRKTRRLRLISDSGVSCHPQIADDDHVYVPDPSLTRYRLPNFSNPVHVTLHPAKGITPPTALDTITSRVCPIGHIGNDLLGIVYSKKGGYLYRISPAGTVRPVTKGTPVTAPGADPIYLYAVADRTAAGEPGIAYVMTDKDVRQSIHVVDLKSGTVADTDASALSDPHHGIKSNDKRLELSVQDLWWGLDGRLYAIMGTWLMSEGTYYLIAKQSLWRLDGRRWVSVDAGLMVRMRQLNADTSLVTIPQLPSQPGGHLYDGESGGINRGILYLRTGGRAYKVSNKEVYDLVVPQLTQPQSSPGPSGFPLKVPFPNKWIPFGY